MSRGEFRDVYFLERVALLAFGGLLDLVGEVAVLAPFRVALGLAGLALACKESNVNEADIDRFVNQLNPQFSCFFLSKTLDRIFSA